MLAKLHAPALYGLTLFESRYIGNIVEEKVFIWTAFSLWIKMYIYNENSHNMKVRNEYIDLILEGVTWIFLNFFYACSLNIYIFQDGWYF